MRDQSEMSLASGRSLAATCQTLLPLDVEIVRTRLGNADPDISALEGRARQVESLLQAIKRAKLNITETLGLAVQLVLDNAHVSNLALGEEVLDIALGGVEGEVAQVGSVRGLRGERELLAGSEAAVGCETILACACLEKSRTATYQSCRCEHQIRCRLRSWACRCRRRSWRRQSHHLAQCEHAIC